MPGALDGKVALVVGASSGIGEATAVALAQAGARVCVVGRRSDRLSELVSRIEAIGGAALALPADVTEEAAAFAIVEQTVDRFERIDILINSAGMVQSGGVGDCSLDEYRQLVDINLLARIYTCKAAIPRMKAQGSGDIVTISSLAGRKTGPSPNAYFATKHAVNAATDSMRQELGSFGIRVCTVMPGAVTTEISHNISDPNFKHFMEDRVGHEGAVSPQEVGETIVFMLAMPQRTNISELCIRPTHDISA